MNIPEEITAGTTVTFTDYLSSYPPEDYTLYYKLINSAGNVVLTSAADGSSHKFSLSKGITADYVAGVYKWIAYVKDADNTEQIEVGDGVIKINPDIIAATTYETRTDNKIILDAIIAMIKNQASISQKSIQIAGRALQYLTPDELEKWRATYEARVEDEEAEDRIARGEPGRQRVLVQFGNN